MKSPFLSRLIALIVHSAEEPAAALPQVRPAFEDTLAVVHAGWEEPVSTTVRALYARRPDATPLEMAAEHPEDTALVLGTAAHALDFDDVHQTSSTHPSAPVIAALVAAAQAAPERRKRLATAFAVGLAANVGLGRVLGFPHSEKGWHATSTIGPVAAAAACAYFYGLEETPAGAALAIAAAQAGGLQRNFGAMAKPLQAGLAGAAGLRAARLAGAGVTADEDVFGPKGYFDLYRGAEPGEEADRIEFPLHQDGIAVKLYPCCYQTHRPIAAALEARETMRRMEVALDSLADIEISAPAGSFLPLRVQDPRAGSEGKFCGAYTVACALLDGRVGLSHFEDAAVTRSDVRTLMTRIRLTERGGKPDGMERRSQPVELIARDAGGAEVLRISVTPSPGSPDDPPTQDQREAKVRDCLAYFERQTGNKMEFGRFQEWIDTLLPVRDAAPMAQAGD